MPASTIEAGNRHREDVRPASIHFILLRYSQFRQMPQPVGNARRRVAPAPTRPQVVTNSFVPYAIASLPSMPRPPKVPNVRDTLAGETCVVGFTKIKYDVGPNGVIVVKLSRGVGGGDLFPD